MEIVNNAYVTRTGAYYSSGGLVIGSQRIPSDHSMEYWQQANVETSMAIDVKSLSNVEEADEAMYIGRIPQHFGHFLMEGLPRMCDASTIQAMTIGYITKGFLPEGIQAMDIMDVRWAIYAVTAKHFIELEENAAIKVSRLYVPTLPITLSRSCAEPWRMSNMIRWMVESARRNNPDVECSEKLHLTRVGELNELDPSWSCSDPSSPLSEQIARISYAKRIGGYDRFQYSSGNVRTSNVRDRVEPQRRLETSGS